MTPNKLYVKHTQGEYPIYLGQGVLTQSFWHQHIASEQVFIVTESTVAPLYLDQLKRSLSEFDVSCFCLPANESAKSMASFEAILTALIDTGQRRNTTMIALGGGVIGDITGFAAHCYQRGVPYIQIPTTLLAQTDASVGGKTAINHPLAKNMIGAFHQPQAVVIDSDTLQTLPDRQYLAGLAEVIKYGVIANAEFFSWCEQNQSALKQRQADAVLEAIYQSCAMKAAVVAEDEFDHGQRALLNFGHTFGHAIEAATNYERYLHGEAVAIGMVLAAKFSEQITALNPTETKRIQQCLQALDLPTALPSSLSEAQLLPWMMKDKKRQDADLRFILLTELGQAKAVSVSVEQALPIWR